MALTGGSPLDVLVVFAAFRGLYAGDNRPVQSLNGRAVIEDTTR